eukprot:2901442-Amphidinium_carterae.2
MRVVSARSAWPFPKIMAPKPNAVCFTFGSSRKRSEHCVILLQKNCGAVSTLSFKVIRKGARFFHMRMTFQGGSPLRTATLVLVNCFAGTEEISTATANSHFGLTVHIRTTNTSSEYVMGQRATLNVTSFGFDVRPC